MKTSDLILQLQIQLPKHTNLFNDQLALSSLTFAGGIVTVTTSSAHGLSTSDEVVIKGALSPNPISSLTSSDGIATAETTNDHDLTKGWPDGDSSTVIITGAADSEYNGTKTVLDVLSRTKFTYIIDPGAPASTTGGVLEEIIDSGNTSLDEALNNGYNGFHSITVTGATTFTYPSSTTVGSPATGTITLQANTRVSGSVTPEKAFLGYTKQQLNELWAFVVLDDFAASKSRSALNDATMVRGSGDDPRQKVIQDFSVYVITPAKSEIAGRNARDKMEDVMTALFKSLLGFVPPSTLSGCTVNSITFLTHGFFDYQESIYIHRFQFQNLVDINFDDTIGVGLNNAFRDIHIDYVDPVVEDGDDIIATADINLDQEL